MAATYTPADRRQPRAQRTVLINDLVTSDILDFREILGGPCRGITIFFDDSADVIEYRLCNWVTRRTRIEGSPLNNVVSETLGVHNSEFVLTEVQVNSDTFSSTGSETMTLQGDLEFEGLEIVSLTTSGTITAVCW